MRNFTGSLPGTPRTTPLSALALLAVGAMVATGCVSAARYTQVEQERDLLSARNAALQTEADKAKQASDALAQEKNALATEKMTLAEQLAEQQRERDEEARKMQSTYDGLLKDLKKEVQAGQVQVQQLVDGLRVNVSQDILFDSGSAALDKNGTEVLGKVAMQLKKSSHQVLVIGHTDNKPIGAALVKRYPTNWELAGARAASVVRLFADSGLPDKRMRAVSVADSQPVASNKTEQGRAKNRRIEIRLRPVAPGE
jgi:chemotaxis protein MotB